MQKLIPEFYALSPLRLWSPLQRMLTACGQTRGTPQQWLGMIRNFQKKGVSATEIEWSDIELRLEGDSESLLHIDDLLGFLTEEPPCELFLERLVSKEYAPQVHYVKQQRPPKLPPVTVRKGRRELRLLHYRDRIFGICIWAHIEIDAGLFGRNCYWSLTVPRGRKKMTSEYLGRSFASAQTAMSYGRALVKRMAQRLMQEGFIGQIKNVNLFGRYVLPYGEQYTEWLISAPYLSVEYWGPHFDMPNIVAHVRTTLRTTPQGMRLLVLEEIQSDWNQALREAMREAKSVSAADVDIELLDWDSDEDLPPLNPYLNHWLDASLRMMLLLAANQRYDGIAWLPGELHAERFPWAIAEGLKTFYDSIVPAAVKKLARSWDAQVGETHFITLSRNYDITKGDKGWVVFDRKSNEIVSDEFSSFGKAEELEDRKKLWFPKRSALFIWTNLW